MDPLLGKSLTGRVLTEFMIISGAVLLVTGAVVVWVLLFRKSRNRTRIYKRRHRDTSKSSETESPEETSRGDRRRRKRRQRPRNPTLAETGGLPPVRRPETPPTDFPY